MVGSRIFIKSDTTKEDGISSPSTVHVHVEIELHSDKTWLLNQMEAVDIEQDCDFDEGDGCELDEIR